MFVVLMTAGAALLLSAASLLIYELRNVRQEWSVDLSTQAQVLAHTVAPALTFDDARAAEERLALMRLRPQIEQAAVYDRRGRLFASYASEAGRLEPFPAAAGPHGVAFSGDVLEVFADVHGSGERVGRVYLKARQDLTGRMLDYLGILVAVTVLSLGLAILLFSRLQKAVTQPVVDMAEVARKVMEERDYSLRVRQRSDDEVGLLVDAFNGMLADLALEMQVRAQAEAALREADRRKDEFLATLAHELRNPLAPICNAVELLRRSDQNPALQAQAYGILERQSRQMVRLVDDLLEVSRIATGKLNLRTAPVDLLTVVEGAVEVAEPMFQARGHRFSFVRPAGPVWVVADSARLSQVFANLLSNASKYTPPPGEIELRMEVGEQGVSVQVRDNGIGIDPAQQASVFDLFVQLDQSLERGAAGLGIGLTLARTLVEMHGGALSVHSEGRGRGTTFRVVLPLATGPRPAEPQDRPETVLPPDERPRVLLADDNVDFAVSLAELLRLHGYEVQTVHDGLAALDAAGRQPPDLAFLDIGMPVLNGLDLARRLRASPVTRHIELIAMTGWGQESARIAVRAAGFDQHLIKPADPVEVLGAAARAAEVARLKRLQQHDRDSKDAGPETKQPAAF